jgi:hypothetical protein
LYNLWPWHIEADIELCCYVNGVTTCTLPGVIKRYTWSHIQFNLESSGTITIYVNGLFQVNNTLSNGLSGLTTAAADLFLGADNTTSFATAFDGQIDEIRLWTSSSATSLNATRFDTVSPSSTGLHIYLNLDYCKCSPYFLFAVVCSIQ